MREFDNSRENLITISNYLLSYLENYSNEITLVHQGFPGGSDGKESVCNVGDLGWEDSLEEGMATLSNILSWRIAMDRSLADYSPWDPKELDTTEQLSKTIPCLRGIFLVCMKFRLT